jgi:hypothetical protein
MVAAVVGASCFFAAGCTFDVIGVNTGDPNGPPAPPAPTQSVPSGAADGGTTSQQPPPPQTPPTPGAPDMAQQRIGTACMNDNQCDPGLTCAQSFGIGPGRVTIPGGYCTLDCSTATCPANSVCTTLTFGKFCMSSCPPDPCRTGYTCCSIGQSQKVCSTMQLCMD